MEQTITPAELKAACLKYANADLRKVRKCGELTIAQTALGNLGVSWSKEAGYRVVVEGFNPRVLIVSAKTSEVAAVIAEAFDTSACAVAA